MSDSFFRRQKALADEARGVKEQYDFAAEAILSDLFPHQRNAILDPDRRKSVLTPRRAGKTHTAIAYALYVACLIPDCRVPIVALTLKSAKKLYWEAFKRFSERYGLGLRLNYSEQTITLLNGSIIFLAGAENRSDIEKLRGGAYALVVIDECKSFNLHVFNELIYEILIPATNDTSGTIMLIGTPGALLSGPFYEATCPGLKDESGFLYTRDYYSPEPFWNDPEQLPRWSRHHWTVRENIYAPDTWENFLQDKKRNRWPDDHPIWIRECLGQWVSSTETQVYALQNIVRNAGGPHQAICCWNKGQGDGFNRFGLPLDQSWHYVMGMDLGYEDDFAMVVVAYSPHLDTMYQVYDFRCQHITVQAMAKKIQQVIDVFQGKVEAFVADQGGLGKQLIESMNEMYGFFIEPAEKTQKFDYIELLNSDLYAGKLKVLPGSDLYVEMMDLQFDLGGRSKKQAIRLHRLRENPGQPNHLCDALLYTWRFCLHHFCREQPRTVEPESIEWQENIDYAAAVEAAKRRDNPIHEDLPEWTDKLTRKEAIFSWTDSIFNLHDWKN